MNLTQYILRRLLGIIPILLAISILVFTLIHLAPGDPSAYFVSEAEFSPEQQAAIRAKFGLDQPIPVQYVIWLGNALRGDFGRSFSFGMPVSQLLAERLPATIELQTAALFFALLLSIPIGILSAVRQYSLFDNVASATAFAGISLPDFWFALMLQLFFTLQLGWLPSSTSGEGSGWDTRWSYFVMPVIVLGLARMASFTRFMRSSMLEVIHQDYITTARAKGVSRWTVLTSHALRNALIPMVTIIGLQLPRLVGGAVIVESVFAWPGLGLLAVDAVLRRDYPVIMGITMVTAIFVLFLNLIVDIIYVLVDPRISFEQAAT
jgi:peptide/nickel transport system permease protein